MTVVEKSKTEAKLPLDSLEIKGYRCFKELTIPKLARVNLITGKNNVGKTSLLEAIWLYTKHGSAVAAYEILRQRDQLASDGRDIGTEAALDAFVQFYNTASLADLIKDGELSLSVKGAGLAPNDDDQLVLLLNAGRRTLIAGLPGSTNRREYSVNVAVGVPLLGTYNLDGLGASYFIGARGIDRRLRGKLWDEIDLTEHKVDVITGLTVISDEIKDVSIRGENATGAGRVPFVRLKSSSKPVPLAVLGDGTNRIFDLLVALSNCSAGVLLIDEIENGLHYSVHADIWRTIFELANRLNVQVFATTHSWECIQAFEEALSSSEENDGELIRLEQKNNVIVSTVFEKRRVKVVAEDWIEVR